MMRASVKRARDIPPQDVFFEDPQIEDVIRRIYKGKRRMIETPATMPPAS